MSEILISRPDDFEVEEMPWGRLVWQVSAARRNSSVLTVGRCLLNPGEQNGRHFHPNCDEVLSVLAGHVIHSWDDQVIEMHAGDVISIPSGVVHNAKNIGSGVAELAITFSSADRETVSEAP